MIAYPHASVPEIIEDGASGDGWMVVDGVELALKALERLPKLVRAKWRKRFDERWSATREASDYLAIYERLLEGEPETHSDRRSVRWMK